jgi:hypothetical protein
MWDNQNDEFWGHHVFLGENPPTDAVISFLVKKPVTDLRFKITDPAGREIRDLAVPAAKNAAGIQTVCWDMRAALPAPAAANTGAGGAAAAGAPGGGAGGGGRAGGGGGGQGGRGGAPGGGAAPGAPTGLAGIPTALPSPGVDPFNPCGGGGGFGGGGGGFGGGGGAAGPFVYPGTYTVAMTAGGKVIDTKTVRVSADPAVQMTDVQAKRYYDMAMDMMEMQRRASEMSSALGQVYTQMTDLKDKVPAATKTQFDTLSKELDTVRVKFGVGPSGGAAAAGGGGGGGRGGGAPAPNASDLTARLNSTRALLMAFQDNPSDTVVRSYNDLKLSLPKAITDGNAFLVKAMSLSQTLKKSDMTLTVPAPVK